MEMNISSTQFHDFSKHKDLRFGMGLIQYFDVVNELATHQLPTTKLGKILSLEYGHGLVEEERDEEGFPVVGANGVIGFYDRYLVEGPCIIVGRKGSVAAGEVAYIEENCFPIDTTFYVNPLTEFYHIKYLYFLLKVLKLHRMALFKSIPGLNRYDAYEAKIPLVPRDTQEMAIKKIEEVEHEIKLLQNDIKKPLEIINSVFAREFGYDEKLWKKFGKQMTAGTQGSYPKEKDVFTSQLSDFAKASILRFSSRFHNPLAKQFTDILQRLKSVKVKQIIREPIHRGKQPQSVEEGTIYAIKTAQLKNLHIDFEDCDFVSEEFYEKHQSAQIKKGDILLASTGKISLGKIDYYSSDEDAVADGHISIIRLNESCNPLYFTYFFRSILGAFQIERDFTGTTNQIELNVDAINNFLIPLINEDHQKRIVEKINQELDQQKELLIQNIKPKQEKIETIIRDSIHNSANLGNQQFGVQLN